MAVEDRFATLMSPQPSGDDVDSQPKPGVQRRSFLKGMGVAGIALSAGTLLPAALGAEENSASLTKGDAAILRFLAAAEIIESDLWLQYQEFGGVQDNEVSKLASQLIPGYPAQPTGGNSLYMTDLLPLDSDMSQYIHDNTEDELTHELFINQYLESKGADPVSLDQFRTLPSSKATGANQFGRLTNLMQLTVDTSCGPATAAALRTPTSETTSLRQFQPSRWGSIRQFPGPTTTPIFPTSFRRSSTLRASTSPPSNREAPVCTRAWRKE